MEMLRPAVVIRLKRTAPRTVFPDFRCDLVWDGRRWTVTGPQATPLFEAVLPDGLLVSLDPAPARAVLGVPLGELTDRQVPLDEVCPAFARRLADPEIARALGRMDAIPLDRELPRGWDCLGAAEHVLRSGGMVAAAADAAQLSPRQLERLFLSEFGLAPRAFARLVRFRRASWWLMRGSSLAETAVAAGFADQPHFTRECRKLGGLTPRELKAYVASVQDRVQGSW